MGVAAVEPHHPVGPRKKRLLYEADIRQAEQLARGATPLRRGNTVAEGGGSMPLPGPGFKGEPAAEEAS